MSTCSFPCIHYPDSILSNICLIVVFSLCFKVKLLSASVNGVYDFIDTANCTSGEGNGTPLQHSCLENPMDRRVW